MTYYTASIQVYDGPEVWRGYTPVRTISVTWRGYRPELTEAMRDLRCAWWSWDTETWLLPADRADDLHRAMREWSWHMIWLADETANPNRLQRDLASAAQTWKRERGKRPNP